MIAWARWFEASSFSMCARFSSSSSVFG